MAVKPSKSIEQIIRELGRYPMDAFIFVQECVGAAAEHVHGALTTEQTTVAEWMAKNEISPHELGQLGEEGNLPPDIAQAIFNMGGPEKMNRHVTGQQLCWAIRDSALARWGMMAQGVLARWNIKRTEDIGAIIFALVDNDWLQKQPTDTVDDFNQVFSFDDAFESSYRIGAG